MQGLPTFVEMARVGCLERETNIEIVIFKFGHFLRIVIVLSVVKYI